jgi:hypothetical protein
MGQALFISLFLSSALATDPPPPPPPPLKMSAEQTFKAQNQFVLETVTANLPGIHRKKHETDAQWAAEAQKRAALAKQISEDVLYWGRYFGIDPLLILGVITIESHFRSHQTSSAHALGYMQVEALKVADLCKKYSLKDCPQGTYKVRAKALQTTDLNIQWGVRILADALECPAVGPDGKATTALPVTVDLSAKYAAYNRGCPGMQKALKNGTTGFKFSEDVKTAYWGIRTEYLSRYPFTAEGPLPLPVPYLNPNQGQNPAPVPAPGPGKSPPKAN